MGGEDSALIHHLGEVKLGIQGESPCIFALSAARVLGSVKGDQWGWVFTDTTQESSA